MRSNLQATVANKPGSPGRARYKQLKPLRREGRMFSAEPVCSCAFLPNAHSAHETAGAARTRLSLRSLFQRGTRASSSTDLPDGQISKNLSSPPLKNILLSSEGKSPAYLSSSLAHKRGVSRSSRTLGGGSDGRGCALDEQRGCGRQSRVVLTPRCWRQVPGKLTLLGGDGGKQARLTGESTI